MKNASKNKNTAEDVREIRQAIKCLPIIKDYKIYYGMH